MGWEVSRGRGAGWGGGLRGRENSGSLRSASSMPNIVLGAGITAVHKTNKIPAHKTWHYRAALSNRNAMQATCVISDILVATFLKSRNTWSFSNLFYWTQYSQNSIILTYIVSINLISEIFYILFKVRLKDPLYFTLTTHLNCTGYLSVPLVAVTTLDSTVLERR